MQFLLETCPLFNSNKNKMHMEQIYIHWNNSNN